MAKKKKAKAPGNKVNEPAVSYGRPELTFFNSFEEMEIDDINTVLKQSPAQRIKETVELILRIYGFTRESLKKRKPDNEIYFKNHE